MIQIWSYTIASVAAVSLLSLVGALFLSVSDSLFRRLTLYMVGFSTGALFGDAFIHILPEVAKTSGFGIFESLTVIAGLLAFYVLEMIVRWQHCHVPTSESHPHPVAYTNLIGDGLHNFMDGMIIAGAFLADIRLGVATALAVVLHEIPTEMGHFSIFIHAGFSKRKALWYNFLSALTAILGAVVILLIGRNFAEITAFLLPFTAGGFIYIAGSDLIPELHKESDRRNSLIQLASIAGGILLMILLLLVG